MHRMCRIVIVGGGGVDDGMMDDGVHGAVDYGTKGGIFL